MWNFSIYQRLASYARPKMFAVNDGNEDWAELVKPEKYGLEHTQNIYLTSDGIGVGVLKPEEKIGGWWIRAPTKNGDVPHDKKPSDKYTKVLHNMPKLGPDDTVFILLHGNAKVLCQFTIQVRGHPERTSHLNPDFLTPSPPLS